MAKEVKKGLLIFPILKDVGQADGIVTKNNGIKTGFLRNNIEVETLEFFSTGIYNGEEKIYGFDLKRYKRILQYHILSWGKILAYVKKKDYDFIWFRTPLIISPVASFISGLKKAKPNCQIILEYGYYPYINELSGATKILYRLNRGNELKAHRAADFVVTYSGLKKVDNLTNIPINNGIDLAKLPLVKIKTNVSERINLVCVSSLKNWHAYERLIAGLNNYVKNNGPVPVHLDMVGNGPALEIIQKMIEEFSLHNYVTFHGFKTGKELDEVYDDSHIAIGTLGLHRLGITFSSSLKNREYIGRGLPMVLSTKDEDMPESLPFILYVSEDEQPLDLFEVVKFAQRVYQDPNINTEIREYAETTVSWDSKIKTVINYLNGRIGS